MRVRIGKSIARGNVTAPPSKSYAHRMLICAALSGENACVRGISDSEDMRATLDCLFSLGAEYTVNNDTVSFAGSTLSADGKELPCRESGSTLRFFIPIALALGGSITLKGTERLISRGLKVYEDIAAEQKIEMRYGGDTVSLNGKLKSGVFSVRGDISSQFISGLMFALPLLDGDSEIRVITELESRPYIDITIDTLRLFGIEVCESEKNVFKIKGNQKYLPLDTEVEGDYSNSAFLDAFNVLGGDVSVNGLNPDSYQGDKVYMSMIKELALGTPTIDISSCPDLGPILFALAGVLNGATVTGTARLKIKESDRAEAMARELGAFGITVINYDNSARIIPPSELKCPSKALDGHNDHRIVMALSVISTLTGAVIEGAEAVKKSFPDFFSVVKALGVEVSYDRI